MAKNNLSMSSNGTKLENKGSIIKFKKRITDSVRDPRL